MTTDQYDSNPPSFSAPPTQARMLHLPEKNTSWPTVFGVLTILSAVFGMLGTFGSLACVFLKDQVPGMMSSSAASDAMSSTGYKIWTVVLTPFGLGLDIILLMAAVRLIQRRFSAVGLCKIWALAKMGLVAVSLIGDFLFGAGTLGGLRQSSGSVSLPPGIEELIIWVVFVCALVVGFSSPVFILIWFWRRKIKDEVARWQR